MVMCLLISGLGRREGVVVGEEGGVEGDELACLG